LRERAVASRESFLTASSTFGAFVRERGACIAVSSSKRQFGVALATVAPIAIQFRRARNSSSQERLRAAGVRRGKVRPDVRCLVAVRSISRIPALLITDDTSIHDGAMEGVSRCPIMDKPVKRSVLLVANKAYGRPSLPNRDSGAGLPRRSQGIGPYACRLYTQSLPAQRECDRTAP
jgi:hypothetical protein